MKLLSSILLCGLASAIVFAAPVLRLSASIALVTGDLATAWERCEQARLTIDPQASTTLDGWVTTGTQSFAGAKTFTGGVTVSTVGLVPDAMASTLNQNVSWTIDRPGTTTKYRVVAYGDSIYAGYNGSITNAARFAAPTVDAEYLSALWNADIESVRRAKSGAVASDVTSGVLIGPATGVLTTATFEDASVTFPSPGLYTLRLTAAAPGGVTHTAHRGQKVSLERGSHTRSKKNPGKRAKKGG